MPVGGTGPPIGGGPGLESVVCYPASQQDSTLSYDFAPWMQERHLHPQDIRPIKGVDKRHDPIPDAVLDYAPWYYERRKRLLDTSTLPPIAKRTDRGDAPLLECLDAAPYYITPKQKISSVPTKPPTHQPDQRHDPSQDRDYAPWLTERRLRVQSTAATPIKGVQDQKQDVFPVQVYDYLSWKYEKRQLTQDTTSKVFPKSLNQWQDPIPDGQKDFSPWQPNQKALPPTASRIPTRIHPHTLYVDPPQIEKYLDYQPWAKRIIYPLPTVNTYYVTEEGYYRIYNTHAIQPSQIGRYRVANNLPKYLVWIGIGSIPDLSSGVTASSATLPFALSVTPPVSGTQDYYVIVREQDAYGLVSQNQFPYIITLDSNGNQVYPPLGLLVSLILYLIPGPGLRIVGKYPTFKKEKYPADKMHVWVSTTSIPDVSLVVPTLTANVLSDGIVVDDVPLVPGDSYYVYAQLYRTLDGAVSNVQENTIAIPLPPSEPGSVHGGEEYNPQWA